MRSAGIDDALKIILDAMPGCLGKYDSKAIKKTVQGFIYFVINRLKSQSVVNNKTVHGLFMACVHHFTSVAALAHHELQEGTGSAASSSPVAYQMSQHMQALEGSIDGLSVPVVEVYLHAEQGFISRGDLFDVLLCECASADDLNAMHEGTMPLDRVIHITQGRNMAVPVAMKPVVCRRYTPEDSCSVGPLDCWYEIWRAPGNVVDLKDEELEQSHPRANLALHYQRLDKDKGKHALLYLVATTKLKTSDQLFWEYAASADCVEVLSDEQAFLTMLEQTHRRGHSLMLCRCALCCTQRHKNATKWLPTVAYVDRHADQSENGRSQRSDEFETPTRSSPSDAIMNAQSCTDVDSQSLWWHEKEAKQRQAMPSIAPLHTPQN